MKTAIIAIIISLISLVATLILGTKNYKKSKRLEFLQRRDQLFQRLSDLNAKNAEAYIIATRLKLSALERMGLPDVVKYEETKKTEIAGISSLAAKIKKGAEYWEQKHEEYHSLCSSFTLENAVDVESLLAKVQHASDKVKRNNEFYLSFLHLLEGTQKINEIDLAEMHQLEIQMNELQRELPP